MSAYQLTLAADGDLDDIWQFVSEQGGTRSADRVEEELHRAMHRLAEAPGMGHLRLDLADEALRFYAVYSYLIVYRPEQRPIEVVRVLHASRDVASILQSGGGG